MVKTALITGASRGIGEAAAELFARRGYQVMIHYHQSEEKAMALYHRLKEENLSVSLVKGDISNARDVKHIVCKTIETYSTIDVLVNNAGIAKRNLLLDVTEEEFDRLFQVNVKGLFLMTKEVLPAMLLKKEGSIVNLSSMWGITGASCEAVYSAAKAAVIGFTKALAKEWGPSGIRINCVAPGVIDTDMNKGFQKEDLELLKEETPLGRIGSPLEIAEAIYFLGSEKGRFITGEVLNVSGGFLI